MRIDNPPCRSCILESMNTSRRSSGIAIMAMAAVLATATLTSCQSVRFAEAAEELARDLRDLVEGRVTLVAPPSETGPGTRVDSGGDTSRISSPRGGGTGARIAAGSLDVGPYRTRSPLPRATSVPRDVDAQIDASGLSALPVLVEYLVAGENDPFLKLKAIHDWIALEISYDVQGFLRGTGVVADAGGALRTGRAVCQGYSELFSRMAGVAGFDCAVISGFGRGVGFSLFDPEDPSRSNHAWNAVRVDGAWYLLDVTWDAGHLDGSTFRRDYSTAYFLIPPRHMIYSHLPEDSNWQLLSTPLSPAEFVALPPLRGQYFAAGLAGPSEIGKLNTCSGEAEIVLPGAGDVRLQIRLLDESGRSFENRGMTVGGSEGHRVLLAFPSPGRWTARIFATRPGDSQGEWIADLGFQAKKGSNARFPTFYSPYYQDACELIEPVWGPLRTGSTVRIRVRLPAHSEALVVGGSVRQGLEAQGEVFEATLIVPDAKELQIFAKRGSRGNQYEGILSFAVER